MAKSENQEEQKVPHADEPDEAGRAVSPGNHVPPQEKFRLRMDRDVAEWFKSQGEDYQARMNAVLRKYMEHKRKDE